jgi:hypothetical protein
MAAKEFLYTWTSRDFTSLNAKESIMPALKDLISSFGLLMTDVMEITSASWVSKSPTLDASKTANVTMVKILNASSREVPAVAPKWTLNALLVFIENLDHFHASISMITTQKQRKLGKLNSKLNSVLKVASMNQ